VSSFVACAGAGKGTIASFSFCDLVHFVFRLGVPFGLKVWLVVRLNPCGRSSRGAGGLKGAACVSALSLLKGCSLCIARHAASRASPLRLIRRGWSVFIAPRPSARIAPTASAKPRRVRRGLLAPSASARFVRWPKLSQCPFRRRRPEHEQPQNQPSRPVASKSGSMGFNRRGFRPLIVSRPLLIGFASPHLAAAVIQPAPYSVASLPAWFGELPNARTCYRNHWP